MIAFTPAKINIGLYVTSKRSDGFHNIETVFYPIPLYDVIDIFESPVFSIKEYGLSAHCNTEENLCFRAWKLLNMHYQIPPVILYILKNIPVQAGLGGGSSDAAAVLKILNNLFNLNISSELMFQYAMELGSDCPFFINPRPAFGTSRGEILSPVDISLAGKTLLLFKPNEGISTKDAFDKLQIFQSGELQVKMKQQLPTWKNNIENAFEQVFIQHFPEFSDYRSELYKAGALYVSLSGSGSSFYAIYDHDVSEIPDMLKNIFFRKLILA